MKIWGVIPVKRFDVGKSRLSEVLEPTARSRLARTLFEHVLRVLLSSRGLAGVAVVTRCPEAAAHAARLGALSVPDPDYRETLADSVDAGLVRVERLGADSGLVIMSDLPELTPSDVQGLLAYLHRFDVVAVSDERGRHTNALGLRLATRIPTRFGAPESFREHCELATRAGLSLSTPSLPTVAFDVDTPEDFARLQTGLLEAW